MAIEKKDAPFQLVVRWEENGNLAGAYLTKRRIVTEDGAVIANTILPEEHLSVADLGADSAVGKVMGQAVIDAVAAKAAADKRAEKAAADAVKAVDAANADAEAKVAAERQAADKRMTEAKNEADNKLSNMVSQRDSLQKRLDLIAEKAQA